MYNSVRELIQNMYTITIKSRGLKEVLRLQAPCKRIVLSVCPACNMLSSSLRFKEAEKWCGLGMKFLKHLPQLKTTYEEQVCTGQSDTQTLLTGSVYL